METVPRIHRNEKLSIKNFRLGSYTVTTTIDKIIVLNVGGDASGHI